MTKSRDPNPTIQRVIELVESTIGAKYVFVINRKSEYGTKVNFIEMVANEKELLKLNKVLCSSITEVACHSYINDRGWLAVEVPYLIPEGIRGKKKLERLSNQGLTISDHWENRRIKLNKKLGINQPKEKKVKSAKKNQSTKKDQKSE